MKILLCFLLLSLEASVANEVTKSWNEWAEQAWSFSKTGNYRAAAQSFQRALDAAGNAGVADGQLVRIVGCLAAAYADSGQYAESEREWRRALVLVAKTEGRESLDYALLMASLSVLPTQSGNRDEAMNVIRKAIEANEKTGSYRDLAVLRDCLAQMLIQQKRFAEVETLLSALREGVTLRNTSDRTMLAQLLNDLGGVRFQEGRFAEAVEPFRESIGVLEGDVGDKHPLLIAPLNNLATSLTKAGRPEEAGSVYQRAIAICGSTLGEGHPTCGMLLGNYSSVLRKLGRKREARDLAARSQEVMRESARHNGAGAVVSVTSLLSEGK